MQKCYETKNALWAFRLLITAMAIVVFYRRAEWVFSHQYPLSTTGFYYLHEIESRQGSGVGHYRLHPFFFATIANLADWFSLEPVTAFNVMVLMVPLLCAAGLTVIVAGKLALELALAYGLLVLCLDGPFLLSYLWPRQAAGTSLVFLSLAFSLLSYSSKPARAAAGLLAVAGSLTHAFAASLMAALLTAKEARKGYGLYAWAVLLAAAESLSMYFVSADPESMLQVIGIEQQLGPVWALASGGFTYPEYVESIVILVVGGVITLERLLSKRYWDVSAALLVLFWMVSLPLWSHAPHGYALRFIRAAPLFLLFGTACFVPQSERQRREAWLIVVLAVLFGVWRVTETAPRYGILGPSMEVQVLNSHAFRAVERSSFQSKPGAL